MSTNYPGTLDAFTNPGSTSYQDSPSHYTQHSDENDAIESIEAVLGTTGGTSVLKNFTAGKFAARTAGETLTTVSITSGTASGILLGTSQIIGGTVANATIGTPAISGGTVSSVLLGTSQVTGGSATGMVMTANSMTSGTISGVLLGTAQITGGTASQPIIILNQGTVPVVTAEGDIRWDTDNDQIKIGDGVGSKVFSDDSVLASTYTLVSGGTLNNGILGTPDITGGSVSAITIDSGTASGILLGTSQITGGTVAGASITTVSLTSGTISGVLIGTAQHTGGTVAGATLTGASITSGTASGILLGTSQVTGGTVAGATMTTATMTSGTISGVLIGTAQITGGTATSTVLNSNTIGTPSITGGTTTSAAIVTPTLSLANTTPTADGGIGFDRTNEDLVIGDGAAGQLVHMGAWKTWTVGVTGFSADPASMVGRYNLVGKMCTLAVYMPNLGTSNSTGFTVTGIPFTAKSATVHYFSSDGQCTDASAYYGAVFCDISPGGTTIVLTRNFGNLGWTNSGTKGANFNITYEIA